jgi:CubicO group peptidase (beta-lactamase class C family)
MSTGLDWYENYFTISDATVMLMQSEDMLASVTDNRLIHPAGSFWNYSSGDANLLSAIIRKSISDDRPCISRVFTPICYTRWAC